MSVTMRNRAYLLSIVMGTAFQLGVLCEEMPIPGKRQGSIFKKIFSYDKALKGDGETTVFIVGADKEDQSVQELVEAFRDQGMFPAVVGEAGMSGIASPRSVVYLMPGADPASISQYCTESGVLSISGSPSFAENGDVSVSVNKKGSGTEIIVNMSRLKAERHEFSAELLKLARVIR
jgi:hypothetical protein